jgi:four helix bundle protein
MTNDKNPKYDLEERTAKFGEDIIKFAKKIPVNEVTKRIIPQLVASGTAVGANYCEADDAESGNDFKHKIGICKKEARESKHWLRMIVVAVSELAVPELKEEARKLWKEANELNLIFNAIVNKIKNKRKEKIELTQT